MKTIYTRTAKSLRIEVNKQCSLLNNFYGKISRHYYCFNGIDFFNTTFKAEFGKRFRVDTYWSKRKVYEFS